MTKLWQRLATGGAFPGCSGGVARTKVYDRDSTTRRRVVITFNDGRSQTFSLAGIERLHGGRRLSSISPPFFRLPELAHRRWRLRRSFRSSPDRKSVV